MIAFRALTRLSFLLIILALTGCSLGSRTDRIEAQQESADLPGTQWELVSLDGDPLVEGSRITLAFEEGRLSGFAGCNRYGTTYALTRDGGLEVVEPMHHAALCTQPRE